MHQKRNRTMIIAVAGSVLVILILTLGTIWTGQNARNDTKNAVHSVSLFYLDELAGRREQVVENNLQNKIKLMQTAIDLLTEEDLSDKSHLEAYQSRMRKLFTLDKFAFVDTDGLIYTADGYAANISDYGFNYQTLSGPEISVLNTDSTKKQVIIAKPVNLSLEEKKLTVCFMAIDMSEMLSGVSMDSQRAFH